MEKETIEQIGLLAFTVAALTISIMVFVPGAYEPISEFFGKFGDFIGAAVGVSGAYLIAVWQMNREREDRRTVVAHSVGLELANLIFELRMDMEMIALSYTGSSTKFRDPEHLKEIRRNAEQILDIKDRTDLENLCRTTIPVYRERPLFWSAKKDISALSYEDYMELYFIYRDLDLVIKEYEGEGRSPAINPMHTFARCLTIFIEIEKRSIIVLNSLREKYVPDLPVIDQPSAS
ncbi:hypothetical protein [Nisaea sp.]|uniref:hypothetical protein n=1 Tax=Nisaea sp. TaxID=2024842 RepID=UPI00329A4CF9